MKQKMTIRFWKRFLYLIFMIIGNATDYVRYFEILKYGLRLWKMIGIKKTLV